MRTTICNSHLRTPLRPLFWVQTVHDATLLGMGRGAGNCPMEILLGFLRNPKFELRPILKVIQDVILPLQEQHDWGPSIPYNITGQLNQHPRVAIKYRDGDTPDDYIRFYDQVVSDV